MSNKPVAWIDKSKLDDWLHGDCYPDQCFIHYQANDAIPLYTHPVKELNDGGEPVKNATYWKRQYNLMATQNDNLKSGLYHANEQIKYLESHPVEEQDESFDRTASHMAGEYVSYTKELTDKEIIESLAELEHEQWMKWADTIMQTEKISDVRFARWASCMIPYAELTEEMKEFDREWARKALAILKKAQEK